MYAIKALKKGDIIARDEVERCVFITQCVPVFVSSVAVISASAKIINFTVFNLYCCASNHNDYSSCVG